MARRITILVAIIDYNRWNRHVKGVVLLNDLISNSLAILPCNPYNVFLCQHVLTTNTKIGSEVHIAADLIRDRRQMRAEQVLSQPNVDRVRQRQQWQFGDARKKCTSAPRASIVGRHLRWCVYAVKNQAKRFVHSKFTPSNRLWVLSAFLFY